MTILLATGEDTGFTGFPQIPVSSTTAGRFRNGYARCAISTTTSTPTASDPPAQRLQLPIFTSSNLVWFHAVFFDVSSSGILNFQSILFRSPDGISRIVVRQTATYGTLKVSSRNAAGTLTDLATFSGSFSSATLYSLDMKVDYEAGGGIQIWLNGTLMVNWTGDPRTDSATQLNQIEISNLAASSLTFWSEIIVADQDTRGMSLWTIPPTAAGNTQLWTPNTVGNINEVSNSDSTFVSTTTAGQLTEWAVTGAVAPAGAWTVLSFFQEARLQVGAGGPQAVDWVVRTGGTDYPAGQDIGLSSFFNNYHYQWVSNPNTGTAWLTTDFTASGFNYGLNSLATVMVFSEYEADPYFSEVILLLHFDGENGSTDFVDSSGFAHTVAVVSGGAAITTAQQKFGSGSLGLTVGASAGLSSGSGMDWILGGQSFTIEAWIRPVHTLGARPAILSHWDTGDLEWWFGIDDTGLWFYYSFDGIGFGDGAPLFANYIATLNTWIHVCVERDNLFNIRLYVNGSQLALVNAPGIFFSSSQPLYIGSDVTGNSFPGQIDDLRITRGFARYIGPFDPPIAPFPNHA